MMNEADSPLIITLSVTQKLLSPTEAFEEFQTRINAFWSLAATARDAGDGARVQEIHGQIEAIQIERSNFRQSLQKLR